MSVNRARLERFAENARAAKKAFAWHHAAINRLAALLYAVEDRAIDIQAVRDNLERMKNGTGLFSMFRGSSAVSIAAQLSLADAPDTRLANTLAVYEMLKDAKFKASPYLTIAAYQIAANREKDQFAYTVARARSLYAAMKSNHRFLTGQDDYIFAAMLAVSDVEAEAGITRMERYYSELKRELRAGNSLQALTQVLVLGDENANPVARVLALRDGFRRRGMPMDKPDTLASLGVLALLPCGDEDMIEDMAQTFEWLRGQKGFGSWSVGKPELLLYTTALVAYQSIEERTSMAPLTTLATSLTNIIIAQQAAIAAATAASAVAASSSSY
ncbi:MAG: DUF4003 family protein [Cohnella sp.]|nr:DUF4003 family protein [Cohnella sp.]